MRRTKLIQKTPASAFDLVADTMDELGVSQRKLARNLNVAPSTICRVLKGELMISAELAMQLEKALGIPAETILAVQNRYALWLVNQKKDFSTISYLGEKTERLSVRQ